jgi:endonuclease YncB( thermonuclease family)
MKRTLVLLVSLAALGLYAWTVYRSAEAEPDAAPRVEARGPAREAKSGREPEPQPREHGTRVAVPLDRVVVDDGDTVEIRWAPGDTEIVRVLGIDTPETKHVEHNIPEDQPEGPAARAFAREAFGAARAMEVLRSATLDPYGRTLGYVFLDGVNYSVRAIEAGHALETVGHYGDNGLPAEAAAVSQAAARVGTPKFEPPHLFRRRMRELVDTLKAEGSWPPQPAVTP